MLTRMALPAKPIGIYPYFDKIQFWVCNPLDSHALALLESACGQGGIHVENRPARFGRGYRQRIELRQPTTRALQWLADRDDVFINRAEIALDLVFTYRADRDLVWKFLHQHLIRRWHGKRQEIRIIRNRATVRSVADERGIGDTRYDAGGSARNRVVFYGQNHSRITGEVNCLHFEWRLNGSRPVRAAGIRSGQDPFEFNHRAFWQKRLLLYAVNQRRLGRLLRNHVTGKRMRRPEIHQVGRFRYDIEGATGAAYAHAYETVQELIDALKSVCRIKLALMRIPMESLLPRGRKWGCRGTRRRHQPLPLHYM